jgi:hypothetical protein
VPVPLLFIVWALAVIVAQPAATRVQRIAGRTCDKTNRFECMLVSIPVASASEKNQRCLEADLKLHNDSQNSPMTVYACHFRSVSGT